MTCLFESIESDGELTADSSSSALAYGLGRPVELLEFASLDADQQRVILSDREAQEPHEEAKVRETSERVHQARVMVDAARQEALAEARRSFEQEMEERLNAERERVIQVCAEFARDRQRYFGTAETQVVKLALAVAQRILGRELATDHLPMQAMVKAALTKIRDGSETILRVCNAEVAAWSALLAGQAVGVIGDDRVAAGEIVLETSMGRVEMGVELQFAEIERGFQELMSRREA